jgi:hypothetical protein
VFDVAGVARHNLDVLRLALAAIVFCSTLLAAFGQFSPGSPATQDASRAEIAAQAPLDCTPAGNDGEWRPQHDATASITESAWKWRTVHAGLAAIARPGPMVAITLADPAVTRATGAPSYLLHTPLLI